MFNRALNIRTRKRERERALNIRTRKREREKDIEREKEKERETDRQTDRQRDSFPSNAFFKSDCPEMCQIFKCFSIF